VVATLGHLLGTVGDPEKMLPSVVEIISLTLQVPFAALEMIGSDGTPIVVNHGRRVSTPVAFPMVYQGLEEGSLLVAPRSPGEQFSERERRLLETLADQVAPVTHAVQLTTALRRSRERVVRSREEERRRLRRDLHDGLGPILSGLRLGIEGVARRLTPTSSEGAALAQLAGQADAGRSEVRRLINDLRPGVLDSLGLVGAIEEAATHFPTTRANGRPMTFAISERNLPQDLPAAVEVAAYWIVTEALHNMVRHANAETCAVSLSCKHDTLEVLVVDTGDGLPSPCPLGVGTASMRERAEEIGGSCSIANDPLGGTRVFARLPVGRP
jgi:signal transduction histidine kinase